ncbi:MAG: hypothetical protein A2V88_05980 [Elusimicrobia bacterium RBG_16_66_12]|nr:MAG: hypothetical protein A2V88_05980 [Elusimicrobia bacterium RBG_16_66_12]
MTLAPGEVIGVRSTFFLAAVLSCLPLAAAATPAVAIKPIEASLTLELARSVYPVRNVQVIVDPSKSLSIEDIRELEGRKAAGWHRAERLNFGYSSARYWLKVPVSNLSSESAEWLLEFGYPLIQVLHVHQFIGARQVASWQTGKLSPFNSRPIGYRNFLFNFSVPRGTQTDLYLMIESVGTVLAPMAVYTPLEFLSHSVKKTTAIGIYCGIILAMVLYNFFLFVTIRDHNYLFYIAYALTFCLLMTSLNGMTYQYLWPDRVQWNKVSVPVLAGGCYLFLALFTKSFLETKRLVPRMDWGLDAVVAGAVFLIIGGLFRYGLFVNRFTSLFISAVPLIVLPISLRCVQLGSRVAAYYFIAFGFFFIGSGTRAARDLSWLPQNFVTENGPYLGSAAEMILLSLGLAVRIKLLKEDKLKSELQAVEAERQLAESRKILENQSAVSTLASQVAHDIRSPLAALDSVIKDVSHLPEDKRIIIRSAVSRIHDIANDLIGQNRELRVATAKDVDAATMATSEPRTRELLSSHIAPLITEKRMQFRSKIGIVIEARLDAASYGLFADIQPTEFKRLVSNLVNNAVEALGDTGTVTVRLAAEAERFRLVVQDTGKGIPPAILAKLGQRGETHGKAGGSGLGLYHARTAVESWGGTLELQSEVGRGTTAVLNLPKARPPEWFVSVLELDAQRPVVVLDDDTSIHQVWQGRFDSLCPMGPALKVLHFSTPAELRDWVKADAARARDAVYLMDYELLGHKDTGLTLIAELGLGEWSILVTSRFEENAILEECLRLKARMIPKGLAGFVPIQVQRETGAGECGPVGESERLDAVLIDDDALTRMNWKMAATQVGKSFKAYADAASFLADLDADAISTDTPIYIDSNLSDGVKGEDVAREIRRRGFLEIRLATGHAPSTFPAMPHIREIVGKTPPWDAA